MHICSDAELQKTRRVSVLRAHEMQNQTNANAIPDLKLQNYGRRRAVH